MLTSLSCGQICTDSLGGKVCDGWHAFLSKPLSSKSRRAHPCRVVMDIAVAQCLLAHAMWTSEVVELACGSYIQALLMAVVLP